MSKTEWLFVVIGTAVLMPTILGFIENLFRDTAEDYNRERDEEAALEAAMDDPDGR